MLRRTIPYAVVIVAILALMFTSSVLARTWSEIEESGYITVGVEGTYVPFDFVNKNEKLTGFDVVLVRHIADKLGLEIRFVKTKWTALIGGVKNGKFDIIVADMSITPEREKSVDFTIPYNVTGAVLICRDNDTSYHSLSDLKGAHVGAGMGTSYAKLAQSVSGADVSLYKTFPSYLRDLMSGRLDVIINAKAVSSYVLKKHDYPLTICSNILNKDNPGRIGMAVQEGNKSLLTKMNESIKSFVATEEYRDLYHEWFGPGKPSLMQWKERNAEG